MISTLNGSEKKQLRTYKQHLNDALVQWVEEFRVNEINIILF